MSNYSVDVSKQGYKKMSSYGQQGMEKMMKIKVMGEKKPTKQETGDGKSGKRFALRLPSKASKLAIQNTPDPLQNSGGLSNSGQSAGGNQAAMGNTTSQDPQSDEDLPYNSDGASSVGAFSMGGFDTYDAGGNDGGIDSGNDGSNDGGNDGGGFGDDGC